MATGKIMARIYEVRFLTRDDMIKFLDDWFYPMLAALCAALILSVIAKYVNDYLPWWFKLSDFLRGWIACQVFFFMRSDKE
jgi:uncharacterized membrane protein (DUF106 family)